MKAWFKADNPFAQLDLRSLRLTSLPPLPDSLQKLLACDNQLTSLPPLPSSLTSLLVDRNQLTSLPPLPARLEFLSATRNKLASLPPLPVRLEFLEVNHNQLTSLPALPDRLRSLYASHNQLTSLPPLPYSLGGLRASHNQLTSLPEPLRTIARTGHYDYVGKRPIYTIDLEGNSIPQKQIQLLLELIVYPAIERDKKRRVERIRASGNGTDPLYEDH